MEIHIVLIPNRMDSEHEKSLTFSGQAFIESEG
jgi:hypothetical protein